MSSSQTLDSASYAESTTATPWTDLPQPIQYRRCLATSGEGETSTETATLRAPEVKLRKALSKLDSAKDWDQVKVARRELLELGPEVVPAAIDQLRSPQPPDRLDALEEMLVQWHPREASIGGLRSAGLEREPAAFREAWAGVLSGYAEATRDAGVIRVVTSALRILAGAAEASVRIAVVEALSRIGDVASRQLLSQIVRSDPSAAVKAEARAALADLSP